MKFKYSAFTENTPEMREWLKLTGHKCFEVETKDIAKDVLVVYKNGFCALYHGFMINDFMK